jgi:hypothetical protein
MPDVNPIQMQVKFEYGDAVEGGTRESSACPRITEELLMTNSFNVVTRSPCHWYPGVAPFTVLALTMLWILLTLALIVFLEGKSLSNFFPNVTCVRYVLNEITAVSVHRKRCIS